MKKLLLFLLLVNSILLFGSPFNGKIQKFKQPDGTFVDVKLYGTEYYIRAEGLDNYTLIRDKNTQWICYAKLSDNGIELISTGIIYKGKKDDNASLRTDLNISKHIDISAKARILTIEKNKTALGEKNSDNNKTDNSNKAAATPIHNVSGNIKGLCIVIDFADEIGTLPMQEFEDFCNDMNYNNFGNNGSLRRFYSDISGGLVDYENVVYGYFRAPQTFAHYDAMPYAQGVKEILGLALNWIDSQGFDFSSLSINSDGTIMAINMMYTGYPPNWAEGMWHHKGTYTNFSADGVTSKDYNCSPANDPLQLAVVAHENGHMIGKWPDTYKYDSNNGVDGIGAFDLMCWYGDYTNPTVPNPLFRSNVGWGKVIDVTNYSGVNSDTANSGNCYKYINLNDTNEFFLLENRTKTGRSTFIEDQGLTVWHVDRSGDNQTTHHEIYLEHAGNDNNFHSAACFKLGFNNEYAINTAPNSNWYNGDPSGLRIWDIGSVQNIMNYKLGLGQPAPALNVSYVNLTNDDNANGFLEASESADINVNGINLGQITSAAATITCTAIGAGASYVTVNNTSVNVGAINVSQSIPAAFNITAHANAPVGATVKLKFTINDGTSSMFVTKNINIGYIILMTNNSLVTACSAAFYDEGGLDNNYKDNTDFVKTFMPLSGGQKIKMVFNNFTLEDEANCGYDYLKIYNGPNTASTLMGTYCGTNSPGTKTSTHATGALTVKFHSDEGFTAAGWKATVSCIGTNTNISNLAEVISFEVYPNPSAGIINLKINSAENSEISIIDIFGREIEKLTALNKDKITIDLSGKSNGMYFIKLKSGSQVYSEKIILNR